MLISLIKVFSIVTCLSQLEPATADDSVHFKIVGGTVTEISRTPYQISLRLKQIDRKQFGRGHICGGTVISQRLVVTATHCLYDGRSRNMRSPKDFVLIMGNSYLQTRSVTMQQYNVQKLIPHPQYNPTNLQNDIALIFINGFIPWKSIVRALPLARVTTDVGTPCLISGWGSTVTGGTSSQTLQSATVPVISQTECNAKYGYITAAQLCAGYMSGGIDSCQGDSGGPLQCHNTLVGIVSYGRYCAAQDSPGVYTNVLYYVDWIKKTNRSLDYSYYSSDARTVVGSKLTVLAIFVAVRQLNYLERN
ncbi:trypsin-like [Drosophila novamexicana]|uniref:trypsin-like n=1 Tax=Drosophila novamexicana TaxID=47314 RepID=UPI0011E5FA5F|nr:trypsin-like [Drosophila novamexicana]